MSTAIYWIQRFTTFGWGVCAGFVGAFLLFEIRRFQRQRKYWAKLTAAKERLDAQSGSRESY